MNATTGGKYYSTDRTRRREKSFLLTLAWERVAVDRRRQIKQGLYLKKKMGGKYACAQYEDIQVQKKKRNWNMNATTGGKYYSTDRTRHGRRHGRKNSWRLLESVWLSIDALAEKAGAVY